MSIIKLYTEEYDPGVTLISNVFIDYLLKDANDAQLKVYLYLIRHIGNHKPFDISDIADEFNHTQSDVIRSLKYWEEKQVISLEFDAHGVITGIELHNVDEDLINPRENIHMFALPSNKQEDTLVSSNTSIPETKFNASDFIKMSQEDENWVSIKVIAEQLLQRTISPNDLQVLAHIYKDLGFSASDVCSLLERCLTDGKKSMRSIKKAAEEKYLSNKIDSSVTAIMNALGKKNVPCADELAMINRWLEDMSLELVIEGCKRAYNSNRVDRFEYANKIFISWKNKGIKTIEDVKRDDEAHKNSGIIKVAAVPSKSSNNKSTAVNNLSSNSNKSSSKDVYKQYIHGNYDFEQLERELKMK